MKILNLYAGIGGNRKLWGDNHEITAVELNKEVAAVYANLFPNDTVIISDAHEYLINYFQEFDFIWSSPPCQTHSAMARVNAKRYGLYQYFDAKLWQEIIFLKSYFKGKFVVENVKPYYEPLVRPDVTIDRHHFWCNFKINKSIIEIKKMPGFIDAKKSDLEAFFGFPELPNIYLNKNHDPAQMLRNCVNPEIGLHFLNRVLEIKGANKTKQSLLF